MQTAGVRDRLLFDRFSFFLRLNRSQKHGRQSRRAHDTEAKSCPARDRGVADQPHQEELEGEVGKDRDQDGIARLHGGENAAGRQA